MSGTPHELVDPSVDGDRPVGVVPGVSLDVRDVRMPQDAAACRERERERERRQAASEGPRASTLQKKGAEHAS